MEADLAGRFRGLGVLLSDRSVYLAKNFARLTLFDNAHLPIHEAGHLFFSYFGETLHLWGGTIFQLLIPALLALYFAAQEQLPGTTFCIFAFFHSLTGVATYMSDAISRALPLLPWGRLLMNPIMTGTTSFPSLAYSHMLCRSVLRLDLSPGAA